MEAIRLVLCVLSSVAIHTTEKLGRRTSVCVVIVYILVYGFLSALMWSQLNSPVQRRWWVQGQQGGGLAVGNTANTLQGEGNSDHPWFHTNYLTAKETSPRR